MSSLWLLLPAIAAACLPGLAASDQKPSPKPLTKADIEQIVKDYIIEHPDVLIDSVRQYQERERATQHQRSKGALAARQDDLIHDPTSPASIPAAAKSDDQVTIVEFSDYRCGFCKRVSPVLMKVLADNPSVRVVFKEFPILGPESVTAAKAALAAEKQGKYLKFHQTMMASTAQVNDATIEQAAKVAGLDVARMKADMQSPEFAQIIAKNESLAADVGVSSTPSFVIAGELVEGAIDAEAFQRFIAKAQAKKPDTAKP